MAPLKPARSACPMADKILIVDLVSQVRVWSETPGSASPGGERYRRLIPVRHGADAFFVAFSNV